MRKKKRKSRHAIDDDVSPDEYDEDKVNVCEEEEAPVVDILAKRNLCTTKMNCLTKFDSFYVDRITEACLIQVHNSVRTTSEMLTELFIPQDHMAVEYVSIPELESVKYAILLKHRINNGKVKSNILSILTFQKAGKVLPTWIN